MLGILSGVTAAVISHFVQYTVLLKLLAFVRLKRKSVVGQQQIGDVADLPGPGVMCLSLHPV